MGNCGIGFAPCQKDRRKFLAHLVEAVEDVPERIIAEGLTYDFETFEEYMNSLERAQLACDVAVMVGHSAVRTWVMGDRANLSDKPGGAGLGSGTAGCHRKVSKPIFSRLPAGPANNPLQEHEIEAGTCRLALPRPRRRIQKVEPPILDSNTPIVQIMEP